jgi:hypothetical protein
MKKNDDNNKSKKQTLNEIRNQEIQLEHERQIKLLKDITGD